MDFGLIAPLIALGLFAAILIAAELGRRLGLARPPARPG
jgi:hypothetical protein